MTYRLTAAASVIALASALFAHQATAADLPAVKASPSNTVMSCATPGRLMVFLRARNDKLDARFEAIASDYLRHGEELAMRWDYAFFQMLLETGNLKFGGDVKPGQNNFAGLGATGNGERGETFKDVSTGVRAHLEHLVMYTGETVANPVAERTRKVQEWGVLTEWQKTIKGPMTFAQLARKWAPPARKYAQDIETVADSFIGGACKGDDPHPELMAASRAGKADDGVKAGSKAKVAKAAKGTEAVTEVASSTRGDDKVSGAELAKRANDEARAEGTAKRSTLGAASAAKGAASAATPAASQPFALLNAPRPETDTPIAGAKSTETLAATKVAAGAAAKGAKAATPAVSSCKVFTASYGGAKSVIIKAVVGEATHYTVLDVNEGAETRESDAYIAAYAPGGKQVGDFKSQTMALDKAFELCPEG